MSFLCCFNFFMCPIGSLMAAMELAYYSMRCMLNKILNLTLKFDIFVFNSVIFLHTESSGVKQSPAVEYKSKQQPTRRLRDLISEIPCAHNRQQYCPSTHKRPCTQWWVVTSACTLRTSLKSKLIRLQFNLSRGLPSACTDCLRCRGMRHRSIHVIICRGLISLYSVALVIQKPAVVNKSQK